MPLFRSSPVAPPQKPAPRKRKSEQKADGLSPKFIQQLASKIEALPKAQKPSTPEQEISQQ